LAGLPVTTQMLRLDLKQIGIHGGDTAQPNINTGCRKKAEQIVRKRKDELGKLYLLIYRLVILGMNKSQT
jgi:hypothetical protein